MTRQDTAYKQSESFEVFKTAVSCRRKRMCQSQIPCRWKVLHVPDSVHVGYKIQGVWAVNHVEVVLIWKERTLGLLEHMLVATAVGEKRI